MKCFTLLSGNEENGIWSVQCVIKSDETFQRKGGFLFQTKEEKQMICQKYDKKHKNKYKEYYENNKVKKLSYQKKYALEHTIEISKQHHTHYLKNKEKKLQYQNEYRETHEMEIKEKKKFYNLKHKEQIKIHHKKYYGIHRRELLEKSKIYQKTKQGKLAKRKVKYRRKGMGFNLIASFKENVILGTTQFHHINNNDVIEIPAWMHVKYGGRNVISHRESIKRDIHFFLNDVYYDINDKEKFEEYANV